MTTAVGGSLKSAMLLADEAGDWGGMQVQLGSLFPSTLPTIVILYQGVSCKKKKNKQTSG